MRNVLRGGLSHFSIVRLDSQFPYSNLVLFHSVPREHEYHQLESVTSLLLYICRQIIESKSQKLEGLTKRSCYLSHMCLLSFQFHC